MKALKLILRNAERNPADNELFNIANDLHKGRITVHDAYLLLNAKDHNLYTPSSWDAVANMIHDGSF